MSARLTDAFQYPGHIIMDAELRLEVDYLVEGLLNDGAWAGEAESDYLLNGLPNDVPLSPEPDPDATPKDPSQTNHLDMLVVMLGDFTDFFSLLNESELRAWDSVIGCDFDQVGL